MTPETKKTLIYGGVISFAVGAALYFFTRNSGASNSSSAAATAAQAQAEAQAAQDETNLAMLSELGTSGVSLSAPSLGSESLGSETPHDNFSQEISSILQAVEATNPQPSATTSEPAPTPVTTGTPVAVSAQPAFATVPLHNNVLYQRKALA
jgi:hypothetical protein